jgi:hypothetical protein
LRKRLRTNPRFRWAKDLLPEELDRAWELYQLGTSLQNVCNLLGVRSDSIKDAFWARGYQQHPTALNILATREVLRSDFKLWSVHNGPPALMMLGLVHWALKHGVPTAEAHALGLERMGHQHWPKVSQGEVKRRRNSYNRALPYTGRPRGRKKMRRDENGNIIRDQGGGRGSEADKGTS